MALLAGVYLALVIGLVILVVCIVLHNNRCTYLCPDCEHMYDPTEHLGRCPTCERP